MAAQDVIMIGVFISALALAFFVINYTVDVTTDELIGNAQVNQSTDAVNAINSMQTMANRLDYVIFGFFIALILALIITSWFIAGNPIFTFAYVIVWLIAIIVATVFANIWEDYIDTPSFLATNTIANFPITNHLMSYLPFYIAIIGFIGLVVMFAKPQIAGQ